MTIKEENNCRMDRILISRPIKVALKRARVKNVRSLFIILGPDGVKQIPTFCELLHRGKAKDFSVLCCSNDAENLGDIKSSLEESLKNDNKYKNMKTILPKVAFKQYSDIQNALYQSFNLAVLHDIENVLPSSLAFIVEAVKGRGAVIFLFSKMKCLADFTFRSSSFTKSRFLMRVCSSIYDEDSRLILVDDLSVLAVAAENYNLSNDLRESRDNDEIQNLIEENSSDVNCALINLCQTADQAKLLLKFLDALKERSLHSIISVSSPKGRGKSAALGLAIAGSLALNYSNIFISSSDYENIKIVFRFLFKGLDALNYKEDEDYDLIQSVNPKFNNALLGINMFKDHPQAVRFILPGDVENKLEQAELVVIDEAVSIPLPLLKRLLGSNLVFMASTTNGYGGAGNFLYESVMREIRQPTRNEEKAISSATFFPVTGINLEKLTLSEPIYYSSEDNVEKWINHLLCLECSISKSLTHGCPEPQQCNLFYVCQETLFSNESHAEKFLHQLMSLFLCSKRTVSPDILLKMADDPDYHIFCLLSPFDTSSAKASPEILCAILVHAEKQIPSCIIYSGTNQSENLSDCFNDWKVISEEIGQEEFLPKNGIHIIDIVTHPEYRRMGYGLRALHLLQDFYDCKCVPLDDSPFVYSSRDKIYLSNEQQMPPLLLQLSEVEPTEVEYLLVSYWLSPSLLRFWKKNAFVPVYVSRDKNSAEEHLCLMMKSCNKEFDPYMQEYWRRFCEFYFLLLSAELKHLPSSLALNLLKSSFSKSNLPKKELTKEDIDIYLNPRHMKSLEKYCQNLGDLHCIMPCFPILTKLFFQNRFSGVGLPLIQEVILLSFGLQRNIVDDISKDLGLPSTQVHGLLNRTVRKLTNYLSNIIEKTVEKSIKAPVVNMEPLAQGLDEELKEAAEKIQLQQKEECEKLKDMDLSQFAIKGSEDDWEKALHSGRKTLVSIKSIKKAPEDVDHQDTKRNSSQKGKKNLKRKK